MLEVRPAGNQNHCRSAQVGADFAIDGEHEAAKLISACVGWVERSDTHPTVCAAAKNSVGTAQREGARPHDLDMEPADWISLMRSRETKRWTSLRIRGAERRVQHSSTAHQKEGPDRAWKTRTGDAQAAFPCHCSDVTAMREKS